jgi:hypothetical protein
MLTNTQIKAHRGRREVSPAGILAVTRTARCYLLTPVHTVLLEGSLVDYAWRETLLADAKTTQAC